MRKYARNWQRWRGDKWRECGSEWRGKGREWEMEDKKESIVFGMQVNGMCLRFTYKTYKENNGMRANQNPFGHRWRDVVVQHLHVLLVGIITIGRITDARYVICVAAITCTTVRIHAHFIVDAIVIVCRRIAIHWIMFLVASDFSCTLISVAGLHLQGIRIHCDKIFSFVVRRWRVFSVIRLTFLRLTNVLWLLLLLLLPFLLFIYIIVHLP